MCWLPNRLPSRSSRLGTSRSGSCPAKFESIVSTLLHEIAHSQLGHVQEHTALDIDLGGTATSARERQADRTAALWALPKVLDRAR